MAAQVVSSVRTISFESCSLPDARAPKDRAVPRFFFGSENALLESAIEPLVRTRECPFCPLVLVGPTGVGKSHLAAGIATSVTDSGALVHMNAVDFARHIGESQGPVEAAERHQQLHGTQALVLEDIHRLAKKSAAQAALSTLLDTLTTARATVVLTSNVQPGMPAGFSPALADRLSAGLVVSIVPPGPSVRRAMISHLANREAIAITAAAADRLAESSLVTWNDIRGALLSLRFTASDANIRLPDVRRFLAESPASSAPEIRDIAVAVAKRYDLPLGELKGPSRRRTVVDARNITAFLARQWTGQSLQQIGHFLGGRDHTTILHGIRKIERRLAEDSALRATLDELMDHSLGKACH
ncbi:MAG: DnaA/Hda family protein [Pirellulales bacterium]|nr:DnaA/Hda family protein [Pirellulales bacterium]